MISIIDYDVGNLKNVYNAFANLGVKVVITNNCKDIDASKGIILPGVGAFRDAALNIERNGLKDCIISNVIKGKPILGICLGMQLLFKKSYEDGKWDGLGLLEGEIIKLDNNLKVPHMGWNQLEHEREDTICRNISQGEYVYFVHSYYLNPDFKENVISWTEYGVKIPAIVRKNNIIGMQFHPEKSGSTGTKLLKNFKELIQ